MNKLQQHLLLLTTLLPSFALAHPGHGLGSLGHGLQHGLWNFLALAVLAALMLLGDQLLARHRRQLRLAVQRCVDKARELFSQRPY